MKLTIKVEDPNTPDIVSLLEMHLALMHAQSPPESVHALDVEALRVPEITFWTVREDGGLLACGALKELGCGHGELKSMHTLAAARGKGVATALLNAVMQEASNRGYARLSLETGSMEEFEPARNLYERHGFTTCPPFGDYSLDPNSVYMTREI